MKHELLRRLSALALALVMAVSLCVSPAWADDPAPDPDPTPTPTPVDPGPLTLSTRLIVLPAVGEQKPYPLKITGVAEGNVVKFDIPANVQVSVDGRAVTSAGITVGKDQTSITAEVKTTGIVNKQLLEVGKYDEKGTTLQGVKQQCYVYGGGGNSPIEVLRDPLEVVENDKIELLLTIDSDVAQIFSLSNIKFSSSAEDHATVAVSGSGVRYTATITGVKALPLGTVEITMEIEGGYTIKWPLTVKAAPGAIPVTSVTLATTYLEMTAKEERDALAVTVNPSNATNKTVTWYSDNTNVVTVDANGKITAVGAGRTEIYAMAGGVKSNTCIIEVKAAPNSVTLDNTTLLLDTTKNTEKSKLLTATADPARGTTYAWRTSNAAVADFNGASTANTSKVRVTGKKEGTAVITVTATFADKTTKTAQCTVTVIDSNSKPVNQITLSETKHSMPADGSFNLSVTSFNPSNSLNKAIDWSISDDSIATWEKVNDTTVKITAKKEGTVRVTATAQFGGANQICEVTVTPITESIRLSSMPDLVNTSLGSGRYSYTFRNGVNNSVNFTAVLTPTGAADPVHWVSKNPGIASVESSASKTTQAKITAVSPGKTTITAIPMDPAGKDRTLSSGPVEVTVTVSGLAIEDTDNHALTSLSLSENQRQEIQAQVYPSGDSSVDWTSYDPSIVTVNPKTGASTTLIGRAPGTTTVTARKGSYLATLTVTVLEDTAGVITASTTPGAAYQFSKLASSISSACQAKTGAGLSYITNLSVSSTDQGILHDQHHSSSDTGAGVGIQDRYYAGTAPQGQRSLSDLSFVPRNDFSGVAEISYTAWSTNNKSVNGVIRITVNGTGDVMYASGEGSPVTFQADDFNRYHANFKSVSFTPPLDSRGVLYYNYTSASQPGTKVTASDSYNRTGTPSVDRVTFVPAAGFSGAVSISYRGTDNGGRSFTGAVTINVSAASNAGSTADISYPLREDSWVTFTPADFNAASKRTLGETLSYVRFTPPSSSDGTLFYNYRGFSSFDSMVNDTTSYYYSGAPALSGVSFVPTTTTPSQVDIAYTGYTVKGNTFTGTIHIGQSSTTQPANDLRYSVVVGQTINLSASAINSACVAATGASLNYIQFTQLPTVSQGALRYTRGSSSTRYNVSTGARFFYTGTSTTTELIGNVFFQAGAAVGTVTIPFTGYNTNGVSFTDEITIQVTPPTTSYSGTTASPLRLSASQISSAVSGALSGTLSYITFTSLPSTAAGRLYQGYNGVGTGAQVNTGTRYYASGTPSIDQISFVPRGRYNGQVTIGYTATNTSGQSTTGQVVFNISSTGNSSYFNDMYGHTWAGPSVDYLYQNNVTNGVTSTQFAPNQRINRCDFVLMLCRAFKLSGGSGYSFPDVPTGSYFASAVATAKQLGIVNGDDRGRFQPYGQVTRQDAMVMTYNALRAAGWSVDSVSTSVLNQFPDGGSVSSYARTAVSCLVQMGAVTGDNGRLLPHNSITRAEAAVILHFVMTM